MVASSAPRPAPAGDPSMLRNTPPTITRLPSGVRAIVLTLLSAVGAQPSSDPSAALNAASLLRATPLAAAEVTADVHGRVGGRDRVDRRVQVRREARDQLAGRRAIRRDTIPLPPISGRETAAHVDARAVR